jgi:hypothetical protein
MTLLWRWRDVDQSWGERRSERRAKSLKLKNDERERERRLPERKLNDCNAI